MKTLEMNNSCVADAIMEQSFWVGDNAEENVIVKLYIVNGEYRIIAWLNGTKEIASKEYNGPVQHEEVINAMEELVSEKF